MNEAEEPVAVSISNDDAQPANNQQSSTPNGMVKSRTRSVDSDSQSSESQMAKKEASTTNSSTRSETKLETEDAEDMEETNIPPAFKPDAENDPGTIDLSPEIQRAEALLDEIGHRAGGQLTDLVRVLFRTAVRAREEAEDIWAEANSIRRGH